MRAILFFLIPLLQAKYTLPAIKYDFRQQTSSVTKDSKWKESLSKFRTAVLQGDKATVKSFFEFPILNPGNDIWLVADMQYATKINSKDIVPFKESDFDKHYSSILSVDFRKTFEKIDIEKLSKDSLTESAELKIVSPATSKMQAKYSGVGKSIMLSLITKSPEFGQFTIEYHFKILPSDDIRFTHIKFIM